MFLMGSSWLMALVSSSWPLIARQLLRPLCAPIDWCLCFAGHDRLHINCCGVLDVLLFDNNASNPLAMMPHCQVSRPTRWPWCRTVRWAGRPAGHDAALPGEQANPLAMMPHCQVSRSTRWPWCRTARWAGQPAGHDAPLTHTSIDGLLPSVAPPGGRSRWATLAPLSGEWGELKRQRFDYWKNTIFAGLWLKYRESSVIVNWCMM